MNQQNVPNNDRANLFFIISHANKLQQRTHFQPQCNVASNVTEPAGTDYCRWIEICREKLLNREQSLMTKRIERAHSIIHRHLPCYQIPETILNTVTSEMKSTVMSWKGISLPKRKTAEPYKTFTAYFVNAKNWWDQRKSSLLGTLLWGPMLYDIKKFVRKKCNGTEPGLLYRILGILFDAKVKYANTKEIPLISNGLIKKTKVIKQFLYELNADINIDSWLKQQIIHEKQIDAKQNQSHKRTGNAKYIADRLRSTIAQLAQCSNSSVSTSNEQQQQKHNKAAHIHQKLPPILPPILPPKNQCNNNNVCTHHQKQSNHECKMDYNQMILALAKNFMVGRNHNNGNNQQQRQQVVNMNGNVLQINNNQFIINANANNNHSNSNPMFRVVNNNHNNNSHNVLYRNQMSNVPQNVVIVPVVNTHNHHSNNSRSYTGFHAGNRQPVFRYNPFM